MRPDASPNACWTSFIGAPMHDLGTLPEKCFTCAAKMRQDIGKGSASYAAACVHYDVLRLQRDTTPKVGQD